MSLFRELESIKYASVVDLIKHDENYDKKRNILNGEEVFKLCNNRYKIMQNILLPLKEKLGKNIEITDIGFAHGMQDDMNIVVKYENNSQTSFFTITNFDYSDIDIVSSDDGLEKYDFIMTNKKIILDIFSQIYEESLDSEFYINSTSKKFVIADNCRSFIIKDINEKIFSIEKLHSLYTKNNLMYYNDRTDSVYSKLKDLLLNEDNVLNIYQHIHIYEEDFPKILIKKTNWLLVYRGY